MKILIALTYYRPHLSGLTIYVERLARGLSARGHELTVLTSRHDRSLPTDDERDGVRVVRVPVAFRAGKGQIMPSYPLRAARLVARADVASLHLPQLEAPVVATLAVAERTPYTVTHHCDLRLPPGTLNRMGDEASFLAGYAAARMADRVVAYTSDYAAESRLLRRVAAKTVVIPPPVDIPEPSPAGVESFRRAHGLNSVEGKDRPVIGFAGRFAAEKGIETLVDALPTLVERFPDLVVLFAGPAEDVVGEQVYRDRLRPAIEALGARWRFVGTLDPATEMPAFYAALSCLVLPSVNSTESFGLVQVEAMLCGTPVVASNLPGVREPVQRTGMGETVQPRDVTALGDAIARVITTRDRYVRPRAEVEAVFGLETTIERYEAMFERAVGAGRSSGP